MVDEKTILDCLPKVRSMVNGSFSGVPLDREDLHSFGVMGLMDAAAKYKPQHNCTFKSYAMIRVRGAIIDGIRKSFPSGAGRAFAKGKRAIEKLEQKLLRKATIQEQTECLGLTEKMFLNHYVIPNNVLHSLQFSTQEHRHQDKDEYNDIENIADARINGQVDHKLEVEEMFKSDTLTDKEAEAIRLYFLVGETMKDTGKILGLSESRVSQLITAGLKKAKRYFEGLCPIVPDKKSCTRRQKRK